MANRFPLIANPSSNSIQEIPSGDNLDLNSNGIVNAGVITASSFSGSGASLTNLTGAGASTYGNSSATPVIVVDANGRITGISTVATAGGGGGGITNVVSDTSPDLGGNLDLNGNNVVGIGTIQITGDIRGKAFKITENNATIAGIANSAVGEIKQIGGAPYYYDGVAWREFYLNAGAYTVPPDTDWDSVLIRATFDESSFGSIVESKFGLSPTKHGSVTGQAQIVTVTSAAVGARSLVIPDDASIVFDTSDHTRYNLSGQLTLESWFYFGEFKGEGTENSSVVPLFENNDSGANASTNWQLSVHTSGSGSTGIATFIWYNENNNDYDNTGDVFASVKGAKIGQANLSDLKNKWAHVAFVKDNTNKLITYVNGIDVTTFTVGPLYDNLIVSNDEFYVGGERGMNNFLNGNIDDLRVSSKARYSTSFNTSDYITKGLVGLSTVALPTSGSTTQITPPPANIRGHVGLGTTATWTGTSGIAVTTTDYAGGQFRLIFPNAYSSANDYYVLTQGMDHDSSVSTYSRVSRNTSHVDLSVKNQATDAAVNNGFVAVEITNFSNI